MRLLLSALALALGTACQRIDVPPQEGTQKLAGATPAPEAPAFVRWDARLTVAHSGVRRLEFAAKEPDGSPLFFRERVATDGAGRYSIAPTGPQGSSVADWDRFELEQRAREGFLFRYRDFSVRDPQRFGENWALTQQGSSQVAGRFCRRYRVDRVVGEPVHYELAVDDATDLVLSSHEFDAGGELVASMVYESVQLDFDHGSVAWHVAANDERPLDSDPFAANGTEPWLQPRLLPEGFGPLERTLLTDGGGRDWLKRTYSDGIEPLFFMQAESEEPPRGKGFREATTGEDTGPRSTSSIVVFVVGSVTAVQGYVGGYDVIALGKVSEEELLDLVESALP